jgi:predicted membrane channel-forming protein YqfA (hemolysin III family)
MSLSISLLVKPSRYLLLLPMVISVFAFSSLIFVASYYFSSLIFFGFVVIVVGAWIFLIRSLRCLHLQSFRIEINADGGVVIRELDVNFNVANAKSAFLTSPITVWPQLIVLSIVDENEKPRKILIAFDAVGAEGFRQLKVIALFWARRMQHAESVNHLSDGNF